MPRKSGQLSVILCQELSLILILAGLPSEEMSNNACFTGHTNIYSVRFVLMAHDKAAKL